MDKRGLGWLVVVVGVLSSERAFAVTTEIGPADDLEAAWNALGPGDELVLRGGTYDVTPLGRVGINVTGTAAQPIVVRAKAGESPHVTRTNESQNLVDFDNAQYLTIQGIEFSGGSAGLRFTNASHVTIADCEIHDTGDVALRANDTGQTYDAFQILRNHIHNTSGTGEGMYLGCNNAGCQFKNALIEGNHVHHTNGPSVSQGDGIELKEGSSGNVIRDNVIHDTNYPCIITYSAAGNGPANTIERNLLFRCGDHGIQSARDAVIRNNIILSAGSDGIAMQPHQSGTPQNLTVVHNTILDADGDCISVRGATGSVVVANNALYSTGGNAFFTNSNTSFLTVVGNAGVGGVSGSGATLTAGSLAQDFVMANLGGGVPNNVFPAMGGALVASGVTAHVTVDDFNGAARNGVADVGAYLFAGGGNPGWPLAESGKGVTPNVDAGAPGMDASMPLADGGNTGGVDGSTTGGGDSGGGGGTGPCSCRTGTNPAGAAAWLALVALLLRVRRRRG